jgi:hypothetical protein
MQDNKLTFLTLTYLLGVACVLLVLFQFFCRMPTCTKKTKITNNKKIMRSGVEKEKEKEREQEREQERAKEKEKEKERE